MTIITIIITIININTDRSTRGSMYYIYYYVLAWCLLGQIIIFSWCYYSHVAHDLPWLLCIRACTLHSLLSHNTFTKNTNYWTERRLQDVSFPLHGWRWRWKRHSWSTLLFYRILMKGEYIWWKWKRHSDTSPLSYWWRESMMEGTQWHQVLSFIIVLMEGEYDALLTWPFSSRRLRWFCKIKINRNIIIIIIIVKLMV